MKMRFLSGCLRRPPSSRTFRLISSTLQPRPPISLALSWDSSPSTAEAFHSFRQEAVGAHEASALSTQAPSTKIERE